MPGTRLSAHRRSTALPETVAVLQPPTRRRRSASRPARALLRGSPCTVTAPGTTPIAGGVGDLTHLVRDPDDIRTTGKNLIASAGPGESSYTLYDRQVAAAAQIWLRETAARRHARPWVL